MARRQVVRQSDFGFGELSEDYAASNAEAKTRALKRGRNCRILNSYGFSQRNGSRRMASLAGNSIAIEIIVSEIGSVIGAVRAGGIDIYSQDGSLLQSVSGGPWTADEVGSITWHARENEVYFTLQGYWPRLLTYSGGVWSLGLVTFAAGAGGSSQQPYYRFAEKGITLTPSATSGTINLVFSDDVLEAGHVGVRFRYGATIASAKEIQIATVVDGQNGTGTVIDTLPPTIDVTVADGSGFRVGEDVEGQDSQAAGTITNIAGNVLTVLMSNSNTFVTTPDAEYVVGPYARSKASGVAGASSPAASTVWDEAALSPVRGYPGDVFERSGRLGFADFPHIPGAILLSSPGARDSFNTGKGEVSDAIFFLLAEGGQRVRYCVSAASLIILTDRRVYYVPEDTNTPLAASTFQPIMIDKTGASSAFPVIMEEGVAFIEAGGNRVMGMLATGDLTTPYRVTDLSRHAAHLIRTPVSLAQTSGNAQAPERYLFALNSDGTLACMFFDTNPPRLGITPWDTPDGAYLAFVTIVGIVYAVCRRTIGGADEYFLERLDGDAQMDASTLFSSSGSYLPLTDDNGDAITDDDGNPILTDIGAMPHLAGQTVQVIRGTEYLGEFTVSADGSIPGIDAADGDFEAGLHFQYDAVLWPPEADGDQRAMFARRRLTHAAIRVQDSGVYTLGIEGRTQVNTRPAYDQGDDLEEAPPLRSEVKRYALSGYEYEPCVQIGRPIPTPLTVISVAQEVIVT
jgi:hypothetical protein